MQLIKLIQDYWHYIPFMVLGWNILSRIIFTIATIMPAIIGAVILIYRIGYVITIGSYLIIRKLIKAVFKKKAFPKKLPK